MQNLFAPEAQRTSAVPESLEGMSSRVQAQMDDAVEQRDGRSHPFRFKFDTETSFLTHPVGVTVKEIGWSDLQKC